MSTASSPQISDVFAECKYIVADLWVWSWHKSTSLAHCYPYRRLDGAECATPPDMVGPDSDNFPVGSLAVEESLNRVLFRKTFQGWSRTEEPADHSIRMIELNVIEQHPYTGGQRIPEAQTMNPVWFFAPLSEAKDGRVDDPESNAFEGLFANPQKQKFSSRLRLVGRPGYDCEQRNLHRAGKPITRSCLAKLISEDVKHVLSQEPLCIDGRVYALDDLVLVNVVCVSMGSVQATLATRYVYSLFGARQ